MIRTEREYQGARKSVAEGKRFAEQQRVALAALGRSQEEIERAMQPLLAFQAQILDEIAWYESARRGKIDPVPVSQIGKLLIGLRIARGMTQRELAERLGVSESIVSRDERNEYHGITLERAQRVLDAVDGTVTARVEGDTSPIEGIEPAVVR